MKKIFAYGTAVLALSAAPLLAQVGSGSGAQSGTMPGQTGTVQQPANGGITDQGGSRPGSGTSDGTSTSPVGTGTTDISRGDSQGGSGDAHKGMKMADAGTSADQSFVMDAASGGMAEVALGRLAMEKASNERVKQFGEKMVADHSKANDELKALAQSKSIMLPASPDTKSMETHERLAKLSGAAFDTAYIQEMVQDHQKDVAAFRKEAESGQDAAVKVWAAKTLPTLTEHNKMVQDISQSLGHAAVGTSGTKRN